jgi:hypothetical protein
MAKRQIQTANRTGTNSKRNGVLLTNSQNACMIRLL